MNKHTDTLRLIASTDEHAKVIAKAFLKYYSKNDIEIIDAKPVEKGKSYNVTVSFTDKYEEICYPSEDFVQDAEVLGAKKL